MEINQLRLRLDQIWMGFKRMDGSDDGKWSDIEYDERDIQLMMRNSSEDFDYEDEISSTEASEELSSADSESLINEDHPDNLVGNDTEMTDAHVNLLVVIFYPQALVEVNIISDFEKVIENAYLSP
ncbi:hypothetical protein HAX54_048927 [Datura stramonium]|uniref:Uncharacterized protein n=1 Tax=Datura stramonium TaxID=4076 RepID=A0ABS8WMG1_DATST|nr:hypothetical protein [Datura stramonium]